MKTTNNIIINKNSAKNIEEDIGLSKSKCLVMLSTYNGEKYIYEQVMSIINQKNVFCDLLIRDDGSNINTKLVLKKLYDEYPNRINILYEENKGIHYSFSKLINIAQLNYEYYAFADQDDIWDFDKLFVAISAMKQNDSDFYSCCARLVDSNGVYMNRDTSSIKVYEFYMNSPHKILTPGVQGCTMVVSHKMFKDLRMKNMPEKYGHDTWFPIVAYYFYSCIYDANPHMNYRQHDKSWTGNRKKKIKQLFIDINYFIKGMSRYKELASDFLERYEGDLNAEEKEYLNGLINNDNFFRRCYYIKKCKYSKENSLKTMFLRLYYLFGCM